MGKIAFAEPSGRPSLPLALSGGDSAPSDQPNALRSALGFVASLEGGGADGGLRSGSISSLLSLEGEHTCVHARSCTCACADPGKRMSSLKLAYLALKCRSIGSKARNLNLRWKVTEAQSPVCAIADSYIAIIYTVTLARQDLSHISQGLSDTDALIV